MKPIETPVGKCFSRVGMDGAWYHEYDASAKYQHTFHRYDKQGNYIQGSHTILDKMPENNDFYTSDRYGNPEIVKKDAVLIHEPTGARVKVVEVHEKKILEAQQVTCKVISSSISEDVGQVFDYDFNNLTAPC